MTMTRRYSDPLPLGEPAGLPYSKGLMARALIAAGVTADRAYQVATRIELELVERDERSLDFERFEELAVEVLGAEEGHGAAGRLRRYAALQALDVPIVLLVGGATGTGKSTVATEAAHRLGITRVTSTDFIRQTIRAFFSADFMPSVHYSSFEAGRAQVAAETGDPTVDGFLDQTRNVLVGVEAVIGRALAEGWSIVLEGVHLVPGLVPQEIEGAVVIHAVLRIEGEEVHRTHFHVRDAATGGVRAMDKYLARLDDIRTIQEYIVGAADKTGVPVIESTNPERATAEVMDLVLSLAERLEPVS
jgi:2-phosphoglycerate kinase